VDDTGSLLRTGCAEGAEASDVTAAVGVGCAGDLVLAGLAGIVVWTPGALTPSAVVCSVRV